jgi:hypothetical protein
VNGRRWCGAGLALAVLAVALVACSEEKRPAGKAAGSKARLAQTATSAGTTTSGAPLPRNVWDSQFRIWVEDVRQKMADVGFAVMSPKVLRAVRAEGLSTWHGGELGRNLQTLRECSDLSKLEPTPKRLAKTLALLRKACRPLREGADLVIRGVEGGSSKSFDRAAEKWRDAANAVQRANAMVRESASTGALPLPVMTGRTWVSHIDPLFTHVGRLIAPGSSDVFAARCWSVSDWNIIERDEFGKRIDLAGFAAANAVNLSPETCAALMGFAYGKERPEGNDQLTLSFSVLVLMHETAHVLNGDVHAVGTEEQVAECWGMQHIRDATRRLGGSPEYAGRLAERFATEIFPREERKYRSDACRDGGALDLRPKSRVWP